MNGFGRTAILTMVSLLFLVTHAYAYTITYGGVSATQGGVSAGLTADKSGINPLTNEANLAEGWFIETFDLADGSGGFNTLDPTKLTVEGGYGFSDKTISGAAAPANDETNFFFTPNVGGTLPSSVKVPNKAFVSFGYFNQRLLRVLCSNLYPFPSLMILRSP